MQSTTVHLMRHGEVHNPEGVLYGRMSGFRLSDRGQQMVARVAQVLRDGGHDVAAVTASPLQRAQESARPAAQAFGVELGTDERLIEAGNYFEGMAVNRHRSVLAHPRYWVRYRNPARPSWGEPYTEIATRMRAAVAAALTRAAGREALLVSHQLPIWTLRRLLEGRPFMHDPRRRECSLASLTTLTFDGRRLVGLRYWEPAAGLLPGASDMVPGTSVAAENEGAR
ncbi:histidine phosphatase family protein [Georgenia sp. TF02-10]|uniref:histidine phosphatase family protein n=1 Tax=Georgenia sp. TF02-10 TaxID=2917725 RepID=UPI001FA7C504|nr:histidine phosphatase family protein [Georgenia sp. TF02-10]UNX54440.1 histidine phosphatase family protein [Georgenia sp. TF02-10]